MKLSFIQQIFIELLLLGQALCTFESLDPQPPNRMHVNRVLTSLVSHYKFTQLYKSSALFEFHQKYLLYAFGLQSAGP